MASNSDIGKVGSHETVEANVELLYLHRLADNDNAIRLKAIKRLKNYLRNKSSHQGFTYGDLIVIWKGLYYCMYNADKPLPQESVADSISELINSVSTPSQKILFFKAAMVTHAREWNSIDHFRMDKYQMLFTRTFRQCLIFLCQIDWKREEVNEVCRILESSILDPFDKTNSKPLGLKMHLADIMLEELAKVGRKHLPDDVLIAFILPFIKILGVSHQRALLLKIEETIINELVKQSKPGLKNQDDLAANEAEVLHPEGAEKVDLDDENFEMDPRIGGIDVYIPPLRPDYMKLANAIKKISKIREIPRYNRAVLVYCVNVFKRLDCGIYPLEWVDILKNRKRKSDSSVEPTCKRPKLLEKEGRRKKKKFSNFQNRKSAKPNPEKDKKVQKKIAKLKKKKMKNLEAKLELVGDATLPSIKVGNADTQKASNDLKTSPVEGTKSMSKSMEANKVIKGRKRSPKTMSSPSNSIGKRNTASTSTAQNKKLKRNKFEGQANEVSTTTTQEPSQDLKKSNKRKRRRRSQKKADQNSEVGQVVKKGPNRQVVKGPSMDEVAEVPLEKGSFRIDKSQIPLGKGEMILDRDTLKNNNEAKKKKKKKTTTPTLKVGIKQKSPSIGAKPGEKIPSNVGPNYSNTKKRKKGKKTQAVNKADPWETPLKPGETEIIIPSKKFARKLKQVSGHRNLVIKSPKVNTKGRTLKINLRKNVEHDLKDYKKVLKSSPGIPFSAHKKPRNSVLKSQ